MVGVEALKGRGLSHVIIDGGVVNPEGTHVVVAALKVEETG